MPIICSDAFRDCCGIEGSPRCNRADAFRRERRDIGTAPAASWLARSLSRHNLNLETAEHLGDGMRRLFLALALCVVAGQREAQSAPCIQHGNTGQIDFATASPNSAQAVAIVVGADGYIAGPSQIPGSAIDTTVQGDQISITLTAANVNFNPPPPLSCNTVFVGPLSPGSYLVSLFLIVIGESPAAQRLIATNTLTVAPGQDPATVPTLSGAALAALALLLAIAGLFMTRRQLPRSPPTA